MSMGNNERIKEKENKFINKDTFYVDMKYSKTNFFYNGNETKYIINPEERKERKKIFNDNQKVNLYIKNRIHCKNCIKFISLIIAINLFFQILSSNKILLNEIKFSNITLKIKGKGEKNIISTHPEYFNSNYFPNEIYINGNKKTPIKNKYDLDQEDNTIKLVWYEKMNYICCMFCGCPDIYEIDFSDFDTSEVTNISWMFWPYSPTLTSLNLETFDTSKVEDMEHLFDSCNNLEFINMRNFNENGLTKYDSIFYKVPENIVVCINENNNVNKIMTQLKQKKCYDIDCSNDWKSKQKKIITAVNGCECELDNCLSCPPLDKNKKLCSTCPINFYKMENDNFKIQNYFNCYKEPKGYYLDENDSLYKKCYDTCEACNIKGNNMTHNCLECNNNFSFAININNNYKNCYENCTYYHYFDEENIYHCTINSSCPNEYPKLIEDSKECIKDEDKYITSHIADIEYFSSTLLDNIKNSEIISEKISITQEISNKTNSTQKYNKIEDIKDFIQNIFKDEKNETKEMTKEEETKFYDEVVKNVENIFTSEDFNTSNLDNGEDEVIKTDKMTITLTTSENQKKQFKK